MEVTIQPGTLRTVLGPMHCQACGRKVVWGIAIQVFRESGIGAGEAVGYVRRRGLYDATTEQPHRCAMPRAVAA